MKKTVGVIIVLLALGPMPASGAQPPASPADLPARYVAARGLHDAQRYPLEPYLAAGPAGMVWHWNVAMFQLACDEALAGRREKAMAALMASQARGGSVPAGQLEAEPGLASLQGDPRFARLVDEARGRERLWNREPGQDTPFAQDLSADDKVAGLSVLWAEARFDFAYFGRLPALDWNQAYSEFLPQVRSSTSTEAYYRVLMRFAALLKDGHTGVFPPGELRDAFYGGPALQTRLVEGAVLVTRVDDPALLAQGWRAGDRLLRIDGEDVQAYAAREVAPYQSSSTPQDLAVRTYDYALLGGRAGSEIRVSIRSAAGVEEERLLKRLPLADRSALAHGPGATFAMRPDGIAVLVIDEFEDSQGTEALLANLATVQGAKGLVIDVRANGGGSTPVDLLQLLARGPIRGPLMRSMQYVASDRARGVLPGWYDAPPFAVPADPRRHVDVPIAVLTSARTFSAAEDFVAMLMAMHRGITVGEATAGSTGQPLYMQLPGGGSARVCTRDDRAPDGTAFEGVGLQPTVPVTPTIASIGQGTDPVLERAVKELLGGAGR